MLSNTMILFLSKFSHFVSLKTIRLSLLLTFLCLCQSTPFLCVSASSDVLSFNSPLTLTETTSWWPKPLQPMIISPFPSHREALEGIQAEFALKTETMLDNLYVLTISLFIPGGVSIALFVLYISLTNLPSMKPGHWSEAHIFTIWKVNVREMEREKNYKKNAKQNGVTAFYQTLSIITSFRNIISCCKKKK